VQDEQDGLKALAEKGFQSFFTRWVLCSFALHNNYGFT